MECSCREAGRDVGGCREVICQFPGWWGRWNRATLNRVTKHIAPWMPGFGVVVHRGRRSGRSYPTPVKEDWARIREIR